MTVKIICVNDMVYDYLKSHINRLKSNKILVLTTIVECENVISIKSCFHQYSQ